MWQYVLQSKAVIFDLIETRRRMSKYRCSPLAVALFVGCLAFCALDSAAAQEYRTWTSANGKHTFEAEFISNDDGLLKLKGKDGRIKMLEIKQLSEDDRKFLEDLSDASGDADEKITKEQKERLKKLGLRLSRDEFSFLDERKLKAEISDSLKQKKELIGMSVKLQQLRITQLNAESRIIVLKQNNVQLNAGLANASSARENNRLVGLINANVTKMELLQKDINALEVQIKDGQSFVNKATQEFVEFVLEVRKLSDALDAKGKELTGADEFLAALAEIEETLGREMKPIGESRSLARLRANLVKLESLVLTDTIKLQNDGSGTFKATVSLNGQDPIELVVDSGASLVTVPARLAAQLKIDVGANARSIRMTIADGSTISGKLVILDSVRMGKFTANNVECAVLGPEAVNAPNLLGMSFLGNFKFELDAAQSELKMMTVETQE